MKTFGKAQIAALIATLVDFGTLALWVEVLKQFYPYGVAIGAAFGAGTNFLLNRYWSFDASHQPIRGQAYRYILVSFGSLCLNTLGVWLVTEKFGVFYLESKALIAILIGIAFNYPLHRYFVYQKDRRRFPRPTGEMK